MVNIIYEPEVYLITNQYIDIDNLDLFLKNHNFTWDYHGRDYANDPDLIAEVAGRICYQSYGKGRKTNKEYLENIIASRDGSVLEHTVFGLIFAGISRSCSHELVRHRQLSFSQLSQRYVDESDARFVMPPAIIGNDAEERSWIQEVEQNILNYISRTNKMAEWEEFKSIQDITERRKKIRESARSNLPNSIETMMFVTGNARAWRNIFELRLSKFADAEIRRLMSKVFSVLSNRANNILSDYILTELPDKTWVVSTTNNKV